MNSLDTTHNVFVDTTNSERLDRVYILPSVQYGSRNF